MAPPRGQLTVLEALPVFMGALDDAVAKEALETGRGVYEVVMTRGLLTRAQLDTILDPDAMTGTR